MLVKVTPSSYYLVYCVNIFVYKTIATLPQTNILSLRAAIAFSSRLIKIHADTMFLHLSVHYCRLLYKC